jgi:hypothetical protein
LAVEGMGNKYGVERIGFGTVTLDPKNGMTPAKAQTQWHSWWSHEGSQRYVSIVKVVEVQSNGRIHFHFVSVCRTDIQTGSHVDNSDPRWLQLQRMNKACREENLWLSESVQRYGFGKIASVEPVKKNLQAVAKYLSDYLTKSPLPESWGRRRSYELCGEIKRQIGSSFHWCTPSSWIRRQKLALVEDHLCFDPGDLLEFLGPGGYYFIEGDLSSMRLPFEEALRDPKMFADGTPRMLYDNVKDRVRGLRREAWGSRGDADYRATMRGLSSISRKVSEMMRDECRDHPRPEDIERRGYTWVIPEGFDPSDVPF